MSAIRAKDTKPELIVRRGLHACGFRFRLHDRRFPGTPDIVLKKYSALIDIRSCFFHGHDCNLFKMPHSRRSFWESKIAGNQSRDALNIQAQKDLGWRVAVVWECSLRGPGRLGVDAVIDHLCNWLSSGEETTEIRGR